MMHVLDRGPTNNRIRHHLKELVPWRPGFTHPWTGANGKHEEVKMVKCLEVKCWSKQQQT